MDKLGFRFLAPGVLLDGCAHRTGCRLLPQVLPEQALVVPAGGVFHAENCPAECSACKPLFLTLLSHELRDEHGPEPLREESRS